MSQLVVLRFDEVHGAQHALAAVRALTERHEAWVDDLAVVERHASGRVSTHTPHGSSADGAWWGAIAGMVVGWWFPPLAFLVAAGAGAGIGAIVGQAAKDHGVGDEVLARVREALEPGSSALVMVGPHGDADRMASAFAPHHPVEVLRESLDDETVDRLRQTAEGSSGAGD